LLNGIADVAEEYGVLLSMDQPVVELTFMISKAATLREKRQKERADREKQPPPGRRRR
jgi:hypothetical protein